MSCDYGDGFSRILLKKFCFFQTVQVLANTGGAESSTRG